MSGHSKWHNIKLHKGKIDAQRAQVFTKLSKEIIVAAKSGVPDPDANFKLKLAVAKAREANMPMDNIKRAIARAAGEGKGDAFEEIRYEGFGPSGVAVIVEAVTDNRNRTASEMRYAFLAQRRQPRRNRLCRVAFRRTRRHPFSVCRHQRGTAARFRRPRGLARCRRRRRRR